MKMIDLRKQNNRYYFRLAHGEDFGDTVWLLKNTFRPREREYNDETKEWSVPATPLNEAKLAMIFSNAQVSVVYLKAQLTMFQEVT